LTEKLRRCDANFGKREKVGRNRDGGGGK